VILITGANAGVGFECCLALAKLPDLHILFTGRNQQRVHDAAEKVKAVAVPSTVIEEGIVDVSSLSSVRDFCRGLLQRDLQQLTVVCNAGVQVKEKSLTADGFETTFGTNHLGHFLMLELLRPRTKRVMMLSSETHDPAEKTGLPHPNMTDLDKLARGYEPFNGLEAYSTSKLCNLMYALESVRRGGPEIVAYTPGFTPGTGLYRENNGLVWAVVSKLISAYMWAIGGRTSAPDYAGGKMAHIVAADELGDGKWKSGAYIRVDEPYEPSTQAKDAALGKALWDKSLAWVKPFINPQTDALKCDGNFIRHRLTVDGFETTFGTNRLRHFLLLEVRRPRTKRVMIVSFGTHNHMSDLDQLARGYEPFDGLDAYSTSKLCNLMCALESVRRGGPEIVAYTPGYTSATGLYRERKEYVATVRHSTLPEYAGGVMAQIVAADELGDGKWESGTYICVDKPILEPSLPAKEEALGKELWEKSLAWAKPFM
ncbi:TPA: hypothetical protein N0F65_007189, partial [Lagenidium giganteum]